MYVYYDSYYYAKIIKLNNNNKNTEYVTTFFLAE